MPLSDVITNRKASQSMGWKLIWGFGIQQVKSTPNSYHFLFFKKEAYIILLYQVRKGFEQSSLTTIESATERCLSTISQTSLPSRLWPPGFTSSKPTKLTKTVWKCYWGISQTWAQHWGKCQKKRAWNSLMQTGCCFSKSVRNLVKTWRLLSKSWRRKCWQFRWQTMTHHHWVLHRVTSNWMAK